MRAASHAHGTAYAHISTYAGAYDSPEFAASLNKIKPYSSCTRVRIMFGSRWRRKFAAALGSRGENSRSQSPNPAGIVDRLDRDRTIDRTGSRRQAASGRVTPSGASCRCNAHECVCVSMQLSRTRVPDTRPLVTCRRSYDKGGSESVRAPRARVCVSVRGMF